jgi:D-alanyl-D-alanine carboxypeptidase
MRIDNRVPGMSAAVIMPDGSLWAGVSGQASLDPPVDAAVKSPFVAGSITKTFIAATIMSLADEGALSIDDHLSKWLPDYPNADQITLRQLLSHTSGVFDFFTHPSYNRLVFGDPLRVWTPQEVLDTFVLDPYCAPGTCYHYSNTGFVLLGLVVEEQTGQKLGDVLRQRWFAPVGLDHTYFEDGASALPSDAAYGHLARMGDRVHEMDDGTAYRPTTSAATVAWACGAVESTATDLASWGNALYGGHLLSEQSLSEMTDFEANPYSDDSYGLGTRTRFFDGRRMVGHTGSLRGFYAAMWHFPVENLTVAIELNLGRIDPNPMADALAAIALPAAGYPLATPSPTPLPSSSVAPSESASP